MAKGIDEISISTGLDHHKIICLDMDGCLVDDYRTNDPHKTAMLRNYVTDHPEKTYFIATFRDPEWTAQIPYELTYAGLDPRLIRQIISCPQNLWRAHQMVKHQGGRGSSEQLAMSQEYMEWKGMTCAQNGATVMVDDRPLEVIPGLQKYGIQFIDIVDFLYRADSSSNKGLDPSWPFDVNIKDL